MEKKVLKNIIIGIFLAAAPLIYGQNVAINSTGAAPNSSAVLDLSSNGTATGGFLMPYMSTGKMNAISSPATSLLLYNYSLGCIEAYYGPPAQWQNVYCACTSAPAVPNTPTGTTPVCLSSTYTYSVNRVAATYYLWNLTGGGTFASTGLTTSQGPDTAVTINWGAVAGTYSITVKAVNGCGASVYSSALAVTVEASPAISYAGTPMCTNAGVQSVTQTGITGGTYSSTAGLTINAATGAITPSSSTAGTYTVTYTCTTPCSATATTSVTITAVPTASLSYTGSPWCSNAATQSPTLTGTHAYTGGTYTSTAGLSINAATGVITPSTSTAGTYTVTYTTPAAGGCTGQTATASVTITALPTASLSYTGSP